MKIPQPRHPRSVRFTFAVLAAIYSVVPATGEARAQELEASDPARSGSGWSLVHLDVDVWVTPERGVIETSGEVTLRLDGMDESYGPLVLLNTRLTREGKPGIAFRHVESPGATTEIREELLRGAVNQAWVRFGEPKTRGATISVSFEGRTQGAVRRMISHTSAAMADWSNAWIPFTLPKAGEGFGLSPNLLRVPGRTTLHLPSGWKGVVDGQLLERYQASGAEVEVWHTPEGLARGFVAGPYEISSTTVNGREIHGYFLDTVEAFEGARIIVRFGEAIAALEARFGALPFPGAYSVVEFPRIPEQSFGAVSEQTHVIVQPPNLDYADGNIQVLAHEASHAWWGNALGTAGPGGLWVNESLAQLGALIAIERLEGEAALHDFLDFARTGTSPSYSAAGYFSMLRMGHDLPIATMGGVTGAQALANSKGVWIHHMLRRLLGDDIFFVVLREVVRDFNGLDLTADDLRERFVRAAPNHDLDRFFAQWLDRPGAPIFQVDWHATMDGSGLLLDLTQVQDGGPFAFDLDVEIELVDGATAIETVAIDSVSHTFELPTAARPRGVRLDPNRKLLIWRPEYGPRPVEEISSEAVLLPAELIRAVVGSYRFTGMEKNVEVFEREGSLYMQPAGSRPFKLIHQSDGVFRVDGPGGMRAEFDISTTPAPSFVSVEGGGRERYPARRVGGP